MGPNEFLAQHGVAQHGGTAWGHSMGTQHGDGDTAWGHSTFPGGETARTKVFD